MRRASSEELIGKTIAEIEVDNYKMYLKTTDGFVLEYILSDRYPDWYIYKTDQKVKEVEKNAL